MQAEIPNRCKLRRSRAGVVSVAGKGSLRAGQVCDEKTNVCEPLRTHRKARRWHRNRGRANAPGCWRTGWCALSRGATCVWPRRCSVYRWRELVAGAGMEQENLSPRYGPVVDGRVRGRTPSGKNRKGQSTDAGHRDGPACRSAGINRHGGGDGRALHRRDSDPR